MEKVLPLALQISTERNKHLRECHCSTFLCLYFEWVPLLCSADVEIAAGTLDISVAYHGFPIYSESKDLCDKTECPVKKGPVKVALEEPFPIITPPVRILLKSLPCSLQFSRVGRFSSLHPKCTCEFYGQLQFGGWRTKLALQGPYTVRITAKGKGNDAPQLFCLDVDFNVVPQGSKTQENIHVESSWGYGCKQQPCAAVQLL